MEGLVCREPLKMYESPFIILGLKSLTGTKINSFSEFNKSIESCVYKLKKYVAQNIMKL